jgi:SsrA-binding protein
LVADDNIKIVALNRKASHLFSIEERFEAGMVLRGSEIKSIRAGQVSFGDAWVEVRPDGLWLVSFHISDYDHASAFGHEPLRPKKLLLNTEEIKKIARRVTEKGFTCVPLKLYLKDGLAKLEIGLARGKTGVDKRQDIRKRDEHREMHRELKGKK